METKFLIPLEAPPRSPLFVQFDIDAKMSERERVQVYVNGVYLACYDVTEKTLAFIIPEEIVGDALDIRLCYLDAESPRILQDNPIGDGNIHGLAFHSLTVDKASQGDVETARAREPYVPGEIITFTEEDDGRRYFSFGISSLEGNFSWSLGHKGRVVMSLDGETGDLQAELRFKTVYAAPQRLIVTTGDQTLYEGTVQSAREPVTFTIPVDCVRDGWLMLDLEYPDAACPQDRENLPDDRNLAFAFSSIRLYPAS